MARLTRIFAKARAVSGAFESRWGRRILNDPADAVDAPCRCPWADRGPGLPPALIRRERPPPRPAFPTAVCAQEVGRNVHDGGFVRRVNRPAIRGRSNQGIVPGEVLTKSRRLAVS